MCALDHFVQLDCADGSYSGQDVVSVRLEATEENLHFWQSCSVRAQVDEWLSTEKFCLILQSAVESREPTESDAVNSGSIAVQLPA